MKISSLTRWHLPLTSHIAYTMSDGKICDTATNCILRLESDTGLTGWGEVCPIPHYLPAYANGVAPVLTELALVISARDGLALGVEGMVRAAPRPVRADPRRRLHHPVNDPAYRRQSRP